MWRDHYAGHGVQVGRETTCPPTLLERERDRSMRPCRWAFWEASRASAEHHPAGCLSQQSVRDQAVRGITPEPGCRIGAGMR